MTRSNQLEIDHDDDDYVCLPCDRSFYTFNGALNHCRNANVHDGEWCERCQWLFVSPAARDAHIANSSNHNICHRCDIDYSDADDLVEHREDIHNWCRQCGEEFYNDNNLQQHMRTHLPQVIECHGCRRDFSEYSAMMIHLESGNCQSGVDRDDIDNWVFDDYDCSDYINGWMDFYRYTCPTCDQNFRYASALLQHAASWSCSQNVERIIQDLKGCIQQRI